MSNKKILRKFGFKNDREGIMTRYLKEQENWKSHVRNTKNFILKSAEKKEKKLCVIIGSGWWLDVPVDELHEIFDKIILIDITHPAQIKHKVRKYSNIELIETDATGIIEKIYSNLKSYKKGIKKFDIDELFDTNYNFGLPQNTKPDFVVSVNILSQLAYFIKEFLLKNKIITENEVENIEKAIQNNHISMLPENNSCMIVDYYENFYDFSDKLIHESKRISINLPKGNFSANWKWDFDLSGNYTNNRKVIFNVKGIDL